MRFSIGRCCCQRTCHACCGDGASVQLDVTFPTAPTNDQCSGCDTLDDQAYSLTAQAIFATRCAGGEFSEPLGGCSWMYQEPGLCEINGFVVNLLLFGRLRVNEANECVLEILVRFEATLAFDHLCQEWRYETSQSTPWSVCDGNEWTLDLIDDDGCIGTGGAGSFPCSLCVSPPATITVQGVAA